MEDQVFIESREEIEKLLQEEEIGYLGLAEDGKPYVVPVNYHYTEGKIIFHCGLKGKKLYYLKANPPWGRRNYDGENGELLRGRNLYLRDDRPTGKGKEAN